MNIVKWNFPRFENWIDNNKEWNGKIGDYYCSIKIWSWMEDCAEYICAISTDKIPTNLFAYRIISHSTIIKYEDENELCNWYNKTINQVHDEWEKYICETYILQ